MRVAVLRFIAETSLYAAAAGLAAAANWQQDQPLTWRFWVAISAACVIAIKAKMSPASSDAGK